jgi:hypothetical protein
VKTILNGVCTNLPTCVLYFPYLLGQAGEAAIRYKLMTLTREVWRWRHRVSIESMSSIGMCRSFSLPCRISVPPHHKGRGGKYGTSCQLASTDTSWNEEQRDWIQNNFVGYHHFIPPKEMNPTRDFLTTHVGKFHATLSTYQ